MRLGERDVLACEAVAEAVRTFRPGDELFPARLHEALVELLQATHSGVYTLRVADEHVEVDALSTHALSPSTVRGVLDDNLSATGRQGPFIQLRPPVKQRNRAMLLRDLEPDPARMAAIRQQAGMHRMSLGDADQVRVLVCEGQAFQLFVGAYREEPFTPRHRQLLAKLTPALNERARLSARLSAAHLTFAALEAMFANHAAACGLVDAKGVVVMGNDRLSAQALAWRAELRAALRGDRSCFAVTPIDAPGVPRHYLVRRIDAPSRVSDAFAQRYRRSPREREVLEHLAAGRSNAAIAVLLICGVRTAEAHVAHVLAKTNTGSRTEVIDLLLTENT